MRAFAPWTSRGRLPAVNTATRRQGRDAVRNIAADRAVLLRILLFRRLPAVPFYSLFHTCGYIRDSRRPLTIAFVSVNYN